MGEEEAFIPTPVQKVVTEQNTNQTGQEVNPTENNHSESEGTSRHPTTVHNMPKTLG